MFLTAKPSAGFHVDKQNGTCAESGQVLFALEEQRPSGIP
jgi:hypothetical protein